MKDAATVRSVPATRPQISEASLFPPASRTPELPPGLLNFLHAVANTPIKVQILHFFLTHSGICLSSVQLATRLSLTQDEARAALQPLHDEGALTYCPYFGNADLCLMNSNYHTTAMKRDLTALRDAMDRNATGVYAVVGGA